MTAEELTCKCGHDEFDHTRMVGYEWGCALCGCDALRPTTAPPEKEDR